MVVPAFPPHFSQQTEKLQQLKAIFPELVGEDGRLILNRLTEMFTGEISAEKERYELRWPGKSGWKQAVERSFPYTLLPEVERSEEFESSQNVFIEGDNLEVLKLLQKSYWGKIKMIYIDPPYNTGKDFIYNDRRFLERTDYQTQSGERSETGGLLSSNPETSGRYHSNWLSMMYPRLYVAKNLLRDDGIIFISIDDHEVHNLRLICDEIFGQENFVATLVWKTRQAAGKQIKLDNVSTEHEYVLCYSKAGETRLEGVPRDRDSYQNPDNDPRGDWAKHPLDVGSTKQERPNSYYDLTDPKTNIVYSANPNRVWAYSPQSMKKLMEEDKILFDPLGKTKPYLKKFWTDLDSEKKPVSTWISPKSTNPKSNSVEFNSQGTKQLSELFNGNRVFDYPKPLSLLKLLISQLNAPNMIVLDFFAGSGTTGQAVMDLNAEDGGNRKFILVQLDEATGETSEAYKSGLHTIADITRERLRRAGNKLRNTIKPRTDADFGFKSFRLAATNFPVWEMPLGATLEELQKQLEMQLVELPADKEQEMLYEVLLKAGFPLNAKVEKKTCADDNYYLIEGLLAVCLAPKVGMEHFRDITLSKPRRIICLDSAFQGDDRLKGQATIFLQLCEVEKFEVI